ncbi:MAG: hypothetical protein WCP67_07530 [Verrucomicrobiota bacterium]|jgi:hypothetical protein
MLLKSLSFFFIGTLAVQAELSPTVYRQLQAEAPEALQITVEKVETKVTLGKDGTDTEVTATATVKGLTRSASGLKVDATITIHYHVIHHAVPLPGPSPVPVLTQSQATVAFLQKDNAGQYAPAARGMSFTQL